MNKKHYVKKTQIEHLLDIFLCTLSPHLLIMAIVGLIISATKLAGVLVSLTIAANTFSFSRFRKKNLRSFHSPIDESADNLALFNVNPSG